jgi:phosphatidylserine/phosphatidylglycerophosphate/cardiolipin synthase-like enzyme
MIRRAVLVTALGILLPMLAVVGATTSASSPPSSRPALSPRQVADRSTNVAGLAYAALPRWAPSNFTPRGGPTFNNPNGSKAARRRNLDRIKRMVNATPGYRVSSVRQCPRNVAHAPNTIRIALYSFSDAKVADALIRAHRRCVSVQVLMNDHLTNGDVPAFGRLQRAVGWNRANRSWARRCHDGCRGRIGPLHSKMFLFTQVGRRWRIVTIGSSNLTGKAANVQWNDLFVFAGFPGLWGKHVLIFNEMKRDRLAAPPLERNYWTGRFVSMFWPQPGNNRTTDRVMTELRKVGCGTRPTGGTGWAGHTGVALHIHVMEGDRSLYIARKLVSMRNRGCRVRVLYGLIAPRIHRLLKRGKVLHKRTIFDRDGNDHADVYTHMKAVAVNGVFNGNRRARLVITGSENFSQKAVGADEVWVRIPGSGAWRRYQNLFDRIWNSKYHSSWRYAFYHQSDTPIHARTTDRGQEEPPPGAIIVDQEDVEG